MRSRDCLPHTLMQPGSSERLDNSEMVSERHRTGRGTGLIFYVITVGRGIYAAEGENYFKVKYS